MTDDAPFGIQNGPVTNVTLPFEATENDLVDVHNPADGAVILVYGCKYVERVPPGTTARFRALRRRVVGLPDGDQMIAEGWKRDDPPQPGAPVVH